jgi:adenylate cyclase
LREGGTERIERIMDARDFETAGLYDPRGPRAAERLELLQWLAARGVGLDQMVAAAHASTLTGLAGDLALRPGPRLSAREIATRYDLDLDYVMQLSLAVGLPPPSADAQVFTDEDARTLVAAQGGAAFFGQTAALRFSRVVGSSLARIAEAAVSLFQVNVEDPLKRSGETELTLAQQNVRGIESLAMVRMLMQTVFSAQMETAIRRFREARPRASADTATMAVGFVDLVGFTTFTRHVSTAELADVVSRFEEAAYDIAAARDGRVVKLVGDEVMFVTRDPAAACDVGLALFERFESDAAVTPRGGIAIGELLVRGGDYYGPIVNLAARVAQIAVPHELLVTTEVADAVGAALRVEPAGKRMLKGFDEPVALASAQRAATASR